MYHTSMHFKSVHPQIIIMINTLLHHYETSCSIIDIEFQKYIWAIYKTIIKYQKILMIMKHEKIMNKVESNLWFFHEVFPNYIFWQQAALQWNYAHMYRLR